MPERLEPNDLLIADDFPAVPYNTVYQAFVAAFATSEIYDHFAGAWNAVAYRFQAMANAGDELTDSLRQFGASPRQPERFRQERQLFEFYSAGFSVFEALVYGLYAIGAATRPQYFTLESPRDQQRVTPNRTLDSFRSAYPGESFLKVLEDMLQDASYVRWREIRNVLTHRAAPGRRIYVSISSDEDLPTSWKLHNIALTADSLLQSRAELASVLSVAISGASGFVTRHIG